MSKGSPVYSHSVQIVENFSGITIVRKGQGASSDVRIKFWLKQLRVAISTAASPPIGASPQISKTNFVDLHNDGRNFQKLTKASPEDVLRNS
jgi:hypothetical protein